MSKLTDTLAPKEDSVQFILKKKGRPVAALYKRGEHEEYRSPSLKKGQDTDAKNADNS